MFNEDSLCAYPSVMSCNHQDHTLGPSLDVELDIGRYGGDICDQLLFWKFKLLQEVEKYQTIYVRSLCVACPRDHSELMTQFLQNIKFSGSVGCVRFHGNVSPGGTHIVQKLVTLTENKNNGSERKFTHLKELVLVAGRLGADGLKILGAGMKCGRFPKLQKLDLSNNTLTDCMKHLLGDSDLRITSLVELKLNATDLSAADLQVLAEALKSGLKVLQLNKNILTDCMRCLLGDADIKSTHLQQLWLRKTQVSAADFQVMSEAVKCGRLPKLNVLVLCQNNLADRLKHLLGDPDVRFTHLTNIYCTDSHLESGDLQSLAEAVKQGRLPKLQKLVFFGSVLTNYMEHLLGDRNVQFKCLKELDIEVTGYSEFDIEILKQALQRNQLPALKLLKITRMFNPRVMNPLHAICNQRGVVAKCSRRTVPGVTTRPIS